MVHWYAVVCFKVRGIEQGFMVGVFKAYWRGKRVKTKGNYTILDELWQDKGLHNIV